MALTGFPPEMRDAIMIRDAQICALCGHPAEVANHRANRGAGGYKAGNRPSNGCALCHLCNGLIEDDTPERAKAILYGVKIHRDADPETTPYRSPLFRVYVYLRDDWTMPVLTAAETLWWETLNGADGLSALSAPQLDHIQLRERKGAQ